MENNLKDTIEPIIEHILVEKHQYSDKVSECPCASDDKECHQRWVQAFSDCE